MYIYCIYSLQLKLRHCCCSSNFSVIPQVCVFSSMEVKSGMLLTLRRSGTTIPSSSSLAQASSSSHSVSLFCPTAPLLQCFFRHWCEDRPTEKVLLLRCWLQTMARACRDLSLNVKSWCCSSRQSHSTKRKSRGTSVTPGSNSLTSFLSLCRTGRSWWSCRIRIRINPNPDFLTLADERQDFSLQFGLFGSYQSANTLHHTAAIKWGGWMPVLYYRASDVLLMQRHRGKYYLACSTSMSS